MNYYNEIDPHAAETLRNLIAAGHIAPGYVDERSIEDVKPQDLAGFTQCHFFAGVGVWSYALRRAGWPDSRRVWTGSCPCQPFSAAGKGAGFDDERHLWPHWHYLVSVCQPDSIFGEQVASADSGPWIDLVHADLEALGYAFGAVPFPSAGVGAPHIRDRLYWVAHATSQGPQRGGSVGGARSGREGSALERGRPAYRALSARELAGVPYTGRWVDPGRLADGTRDRRREKRPDDGGGLVGDGAQGHAPGLGGGGGDQRPGPTNGLWRDADWLFCRDGKWRPVEPGTLPLANGAPARVGRLRAYGNAINAEAARVFIEATGLVDHESA